MGAPNSLSPGGQQMLPPNLAQLLRVPQNAGALGLPQGAFGGPPPNPMGGPPPLSQGAPPPQGPGTPPMASPPPPGAAATSPPPNMMNPAMMAQMQAFQRSQMPGQAAMGMGNAPPGQGGGLGNALSKLALGLMQRNSTQQYNDKYR